MQNKTNGKAIASLIVGIISILCCCVWVLSMLLGIAAVVLGILAMRGENQNQRDAAIAGIVVGTVGFTLGMSVAVMQAMLYAGIGENEITVSVLRNR